MLLLQKKKKKLLPPSSETDLTSMRHCDLQLKKKQETMQVRIEYDSIDVVQMCPNLLLFICYVIMECGWLLGGVY